MNSLRSRGVSMVEILIAALIIGVSAIPVLELVRSGTSQLEVTEIEAAARQLGSDVLERVAAPLMSGDKEKEIEQKFRGLMKTPLRWSQIVNADDSLKKDFPKKGQGLPELLDLYDVRVRLEVKSPYPHASLGPSSTLEAYIVTVDWKDRKDERKEVTFARLVEM